MTDRDILEHVACILDARVDAMRVRDPAAWKPSYRITISGERAACLMRQLRPLMGERRQKQIDAALEARERALQRPSLDSRRSRNIEIAQRLSDGESGRALAREFGVTHQNIYYIGKKYRTAACPSG